MEVLGDSAVAHFDEPSLGVSPGQYAVLYRDERVLGSGRQARQGPA